MRLLNKIFSPVLLSLSVLLLIYTFYKSQIIWTGEKNDFYFKYYIFSFSLLVFSLATFFFNKIWKDYLIITSISVFLTLYLFESYLNYKNYLQFSDKIKQYKIKTGRNYDQRSRIEFYNDLKKKNDNVKVVVFPSSYTEENELFPLSSHSNSETVFCNENGYFSTYVSDRFGFNNPDNEWDKDQIEYLLVGDSFTNGACVNRPDDIASILRKLSNKAVLNLGYSSNGPLTEYATLREYMGKNVKKVLWMYYEGNDLGELGLELLNGILIKYLEDKEFSQNLKNRQKEINLKANSKINSESQIRRKDKFLKFIKLTKVRYIFIEKPETAIKSEFIEVIKSAKSLIEKNNAELYFVYLPEYSRYKTNLNNKNYEEVKKIINDLNIPMIDIHNEVFVKEKYPTLLFPFGYFGHYNELGYQKVARTIFQLTR